MFDIYFACSSTRGEDPLRLTDTKDITKAKSYFNDEKRYGKHFVKINKYCINVRNIAFIESKNDSVVVTFNARISDAFVRLDVIWCGCGKLPEEKRRVLMSGSRRHHWGVRRVAHSARRRCSATVAVMSRIALLVAGHSAFGLTIA